MTRPTPQQAEAYRFVYIHQCTHEQAAKLMACSRINVTRLLLRLKKTNPQLFTSKQAKINIIPYDPSLDSHVIDKF